MKINYNLTGINRKSLIAVISKELNSPIKYLGTPTFAYKIEDYLIDKNGILIGEDNQELVAILRNLHGFIAVTEVYDYDTLIIEIPLTGFTPEKLENLTKLVNAKASLIKAALNIKDLPIQHTEETLSFPWFRANNEETVKAYTMLYQ